jgi:hypothetical protein
MIDKADLNLFSSGHFTGVISGRLWDRIRFFKPISHEDFGIVSVAYLFHGFSKNRKWNFYISINLKINERINTIIKKIEKITKYLMKLIE